MRIQAFVFNWRGQLANTLRLEASLRPLVPTTVINSDEEVARGGPDWHHLGEQAFFSAQWNRALELFDGDLMLHVQADAAVDDPERLLARAATLVSRYDLGVYEPNVDFTDIQYQRERLHLLEPDLALVPLTDCTCWFIHGDVVRQLAPVDLRVNRYGWGISAAVAGRSYSGGRLCARDYSFTIRHPRRRGYSTADALAQRTAYADSLGPDLGEWMVRLYGAFSAIRAPRPGVNLETGADRSCHG